MSMATTKPRDWPSADRKFRKPETYQELFELQTESTMIKQVVEGQAARSCYVAKYGHADDLHPDSWFVGKAPAPSPATVKKYMSRGASALAKSNDGIDLWDMQIATLGRRGSWNTAKVGIRYYLLEQLKEDKRTIDRLSRELPGIDAAVKRAVGSNLAQARSAYNEARKVYNEAITRLPRIVNALIRIPTEPPDKFKKGSVLLSRSRSKSLSTRRAQHNWRERVAHALQPRRVVFWLTQCATGCRPQELANGVNVSWLLNGHFKLTINGAKVGTHAGQKQRTIQLNPSVGGIVETLANLLRSSAETNIRLAEEVNTYGQAIRRACAQVLPSQDARKALSSYSARHQYKADLKNAGLTRVEIAKALGHRTTRSAKYYGIGVRSGSSGVQPVAIAATSEVKLRPAFPKRASTHSAKPMTIQPKRPKPGSQ